MITNIKHFKEIDSTNRLMLRSVDRLADGTVFIADRQTHGRGRYGRSWKSDSPGNLYMSLLLKDQSELIQSVQHLTVFSAMLTMECLDRYLLPLGLKTSMKWPNDVTVQGKKISGILAECSWWGQHLQHVVIGIGINLFMTTNEIDLIDQPCTSLNLEIGYQVDREVFAKEWLAIFLKNYRLFLTRGLCFRDKPLNASQRINHEKPLEVTINQGTTMNNLYQQLGEL